VIGCRVPRIESAVSPEREDVRDEREPERHSRQSMVDEPPNDVTCNAVSPQPRHVTARQPAQSVLDRNLSRLTPGRHGCERVGVPYRATLGVVPTLRQTLPATALAGATYVDQLDIGSREVVTDAQQRNVEMVSQRTREAVAEVEASRMVSLPELQPAVGGDCSNSLLSLKSVTKRDGDWVVRVPP